MVFFRRMRIMSRSAVIEDIGEYNRIHEMFQTLQPDNEVKSQIIEGFKNYPVLEHLIICHLVLFTLQKLDKVNQWLLVSGHRLGY